MSLIDQIIDDVAEITSGDAAIDLFMVSPDALEMTVPGFHAKHHLGLNPDTGAAVNSKKATVSFSEKNCKYPIRNKDEEVDLSGWRIRCKDSSGKLKQYKVGQWFPDETIGLITVILLDCAD